MTYTGFDGKDDDHGTSQPRVTKKPAKVKKSVTKKKARKASKKNVWQEPLTNPGAQVKY